MEKSKIPECNVCGSKTYDNQDGLYFCSVCMTQSQEFREEELDEENEETYFSGNIRVYKKTPNKSESEKVKERSWHPLEAYQAILRKMVFALIEKGADPSLQDVVFRIWCKYLSICGFAFHEKKGKENRFAQQKMFPRKGKRKLSEEDEETEDEEAYMMITMEEDFYDVDIPSQEDTEIDDATEDIPTLEDDTLKWPKQFKFGMTMLLSICHIGMMYLHPQNTAADLVRWVNNGQIPMKYGTISLPAYMKIMSTKDFPFLNCSLPVLIEDLCPQTHKMIHFLSLQNISLPSLTILINKYLSILDLPVEMAGLIHNLHEAIKTEKHYNLENFTLHKFQDLDSLAVSYILVTIEIFMGLNDTMERMLSVYTKELESTLDKERNILTNFFLWDSWVDHIQNKFKKRTGENLVSQNMMAEDLSDVKEFKKAFQENSLLSQQLKIGLPYRLLSEEARTTLNQTINGLKCSFGGTSSCEMEDSLSSEQNNREKIAQEFRFSKFLHICSPEVFSKSVLEMDNNFRMEEDNYESHSCLVIRKQDFLAAVKNISLLQESLYVSEDWEHKTLKSSMSYCWLINVLSRVIGTKPDTLLNVLNRMQVYLRNFISRNGPGHCKILQVLKWQLRHIPFSLQ